MGDPAKGDVVKKFKGQKIHFLLVISALWFLGMVAYEVMYIMNFGFPNLAVVFLGIPMYAFLVIAARSRPGLVLYTKGIDIPMTYFQYLMNERNRFYSYDDIVAIYPYRYEVAVGVGYREYNNYVDPGQTILMGYTIELKDERSYSIRSNRSGRNRSDASKDTKGNLRHLQKRYEKMGTYMVKQMPPEPKELRMADIPSVYRAIMFLGPVGLIGSLIAPFVLLMGFGFLLHSVLGVIPESFVYSFFILLILLSVVPTLIYAYYYHKSRLWKMNWHNKGIKYEWAANERKRLAGKEG